MPNQDHVFIKIDLVRGKPDALACVRTDRKGEAVRSYLGAVSTEDEFPDLVEALKREILSGLHNEYVVVSHYADVERAILRKEHARSDEVFEGRLWISVSQLLWPMVECQMLPSTTFGAACSYFGVAHHHGKLAPSAESDCTSLVRIYFEMMRRYRAALIVEEGVRDLGGATFDKMRRMVGL